MARSRRFSEGSGKCDLHKNATGCMFEKATALSQHGIKIQSRYRLKINRSSATGNTYRSRL